MLVWHVCAAPDIACCADLACLLFLQAQKVREEEDEDDDLSDPGGHTALLPARRCEKW